MSVCRLMHTWLALLCDVSVLMFGNADMLQNGHATCNMHSCQFHAKTRAYVFADSTARVVRARTLHVHPMCASTHTHRFDEKHTQMRIHPHAAA
jgi:hypothetical protein